MGICTVCRPLFLLDEFPVGNIPTCGDESTDDEIADQLAMEIIDDYFSGAARPTSQNQN